MYPLVSIVVPNRNGQDFIGDAIDSCLQQTYQNLEIIVVDDHSTDDSIAYVETSYRSLVQLHTSVGYGASAARNTGLEVATGAYIKFLDADDVLVPNAIEQQIEIALDLPPNTVTYGNYAVASNDGLSRFDNYKTRDQGFPSLIHHDVLISTPLHEADALSRVGGFDVRLFRHQEWNLHVRLLLNGVRFHHHPVNTFIYRDMGNKSKISTKFKQSEARYDACIKCLRCTFPEWPKISKKLKVEISKYLRNCAYRELRYGEVRVALQFFQQSLFI